MELFDAYPEAIGGEMEGSGVYAASERRGISEWLIVKAVCDWGDGTKHKEHQPLAAAVAAALIEHVFTPKGVLDDLPPFRFVGEDPADAPANSSAIINNAGAVIGAQNIGYKAPTFPGWTRVAFDEQDGIEAALLGQSMGPRHVVACPQVPEVRDVVNNLERLGAVAVTGDSGSGKSMLVWHAAYELHKSGWEVYLLTNPLAATGELPHATPRALLVIDDAQSLGDVPARAAAASNRRAIVVVSTSRVPGFRIEVRLSGRRCVEAIAASLRQQESELLPVLSRLNPHLGPRAFDDRIGFHIDDAKRRSEFPWQFMFNLGGGHLRLEGKLAAVALSPPLDGLLYALSAYQLATRDTPCPPQWLLAHSAIGIHGTDDLVAYVRTLQGHVELVWTTGGIATPHPRVAGAIIRKLFYGTELGAQRRRDLLWEVLRDVTFPLRGVRWLLDELPDDLRVWFGLTDDLSTLLVDRCYASEDIGGAALVLSHLLSYRKPQSSAATRSFAEQSKTIVRWIETCDAEQAGCVGSLVNSIINRDRITAEALIDSVDPLTVADRIQGTTPADGYAQGALIDRLTFGSKDWAHPGFRWVAG